MGRGLVEKLGYEKGDLDRIPAGDVFTAALMGTRTFGENCFNNGLVNAVLEFNILIIKSL
jgi:hypothetical protein